MDKISLAILNYNQGTRIDRAIRSCQNQYRTWFEIEIIVVDDCSTDDSLQTIQEFENEIKLIRNQENLGVGASSNVAFENHTGNFFMRVDADDFLSPISCAALSLALNSNPSASYAYGDHFRVNEKGFKQELVRLNNFESLIKHGAGVLYRSTDLRKIGAFDSDLRNCEDMDLLFRFSKNKNFGSYVPLPLYRYYQHAGNISQTIKQKEAERILRAKYGF